MSRRYLIIPADYSPDNIPPSKLRKLHREGPDEHNAEIVVVNGGIEEDRMMYRPRLEYIFDAEIPPVPDNTYAGGKRQKRVLGMEKPPDIIKGAPPIYQIIYKMCEESKGILEEDILEKFEDLGWFENVDFAGPESIKKAMDNMKKNMIITPDPDKGTWHIGTKDLSYFYDLDESGGHDVRDGPYPTVRLIKNIMDRENTIKSYKLLEKIVEWNYAIDRKSGKRWIEHCLSMGYIKHAGDGMLAPGKALKN